MAGDDQTRDNNHKGFNECVSQEQLQAVVDNAQKRMNAAIRKAITDALIELNIGNNMERLDKWFSMLTDKVTELETFVAVNNDVSGSNTNGLLPEDHRSSSLPTSKITMTSSPQHDRYGWCPPPSR